MGAYSKILKKDDVSQYLHLILYENTTKCVYPVKGSNSGYFSWGFFPFFI